MDKDDKVERDGGIGFTDLHDFNKTLLATGAWRLQSNPDVSWAQVLKGLYFTKVDLMDTRKGSRPSWLWACLIEGKEVMKKGVLWQMGDGGRVRV